MDQKTAAEILAAWPEDAHEAAQAVVDKYGEPHEATESQLTWHRVGPWKRVMAQRASWQHDFPAPHADSVETVIDYRVSPEMFTALALFDGSVMAERTTGEMSARCHDEQANSLALNLANDIVTNRKTVAQARAYYAKEFLDARRKRPTPYMDQLTFVPLASAAADADTRVLSEAELNEAVAEGQNALR